MLHTCAECGDPEIRTLRFHKLAFYMYMYVHMSYLYALCLASISLKAEHIKTLATCVLTFD